MEASTHITGAIIVDPAAHITHADKIIHVSHLTDTQHVAPPNPNLIWHIAIYDTGDGIDLYVYPRSLSPG